MFGVYYDSSATVISCNNFRASMLVADGLAPIWRQSICINHDDVGGQYVLGVSQFNASSWAN